MRFFRMVGHNDEKEFFSGERSRPHKLFHCIQVMRKSESILLHTHNAMTSKFPCFTQQWISFKLTAAYSFAQNVSFHPNKKIQGNTHLRTIDSARDFLTVEKLSSLWKFEWSGLGQAFVNGQALQLMIKWRVEIPSYRLSKVPSICFGRFLTFPCRYVHKLLWEWEDRQINKISLNMLLWKITKHYNQRALSSRVLMARDQPNLNMFWAMLLLYHHK